MIDAPKSSRSLAKANKNRKYSGVAFDVAPWMEAAWSTCMVVPDDAGSKAERAEIEKSMTEDLRRNLEYARLDFACFVEIDGQKVPRGLIYSTPKL